MRTVERFGMRFSERASAALDELSELVAEGAAAGMSDTELAELCKQYLAELGPPVIVDGATLH